MFLNMLQSHLFIFNSFSRYLNYINKFNKIIVKIDYQIKLISSSSAHLYFIYSLTNLSNSQLL